MSTRANLLDESVWTTVQRDLNYMGGKIRTALLAPLYVTRVARSYASLSTFTTGGTTSELADRERVFANWELWGPFLSFFMYCAFTSRSDETFTFLFTQGLLLLTASAITAQLVLQVRGVPMLRLVCTLGYSLVPMTLMAILSRIISPWPHIRFLGGLTRLVGVILAGLGGTFSFVWSVLTAFVLISETILVRLQAETTSSAALTMTSGDSSIERVIERRPWFLLLLPLIAFYGFLIWSLVISLLSI